jgi:hypothetical protein
VLVSRLLAAAAGVAGLAIGAPPAAAAVVDEPYAPVAGPRLAGEQVLVVGAPPRGPSSGVELRSAPAAGGIARVAWARVPGSAPRTRMVAQLEASPERVALGLGVDTAVGPSDVTQVVEYLQGPVGAPLELLARCGLPLGYAADVDAGGATVAHHGFDCGRSSAVPATLTEFSGPEPRSVALPSGATSLHVAGRFALAAEPDPPAYVVYEASTGAALRRIAATGLRPVDLRDDGAVLFAPTTGGGRLAVSEPGATSAREIPAPSSTFFARFAPRGLVLSRGPAAYRTASPRATLELRDLDGRLLRVLARGVHEERFGERFDVAGDRVAFVTRGCRAMRVHVRALDEPTLDWSPPRRCRADLLARPALSRSGRLLRFRASCRGLVHACLRTSASVTVRAGGRRRIIATGSQSPAPAETNRFTLRLNSFGRRLVGRRRTVAITVRYRVGDPPLLERAASTTEPEHLQWRTGRYLLERRR